MHHASGPCLKARCDCWEYLEPAQGQEDPAPTAEELLAMAQEDQACTADSPPSPRPPVAVAYSVGGRLYEVVVSGDAAVSAVDGRLVIDHPGRSVFGIARTMPWPPPAAEGEPDGPGTEDPQG